MSQSKVFLSVAVVAVVFASLASAQIDANKCRKAIASLTSKFIDINRELLSDLQKKATSNLDQSANMEQFTDILKRINGELTNMGTHIQAMDASQMMNSAMNIARYQTEVYPLFMNPSFAFQMYDIYFEYLQKSMEKNMEIMTKVPAGCVPSRRGQTTQ